MALPDNLERLRQISIDTLSLSESTSALLKWFNFTTILDCIVYFSEAAHYTYLEVTNPWPRLYLLLFDEVKPALITAGYWDLVLDTEMGRTLDKYKWGIRYAKRDQRVVPWQGKDHVLNNIPFEQLGLSDPPTEVRFHFNNIEACIDYFLYQLGENPEYWLDIGKYPASEMPANESLDLDKYMFGIVQPRLVKIGLWAFVEEHVDDFDMDKGDVESDEDTWDGRGSEDGDDDFEMADESDDK